MSRFTPLSTAVSLISLTMFYGHTGTENNKEKNEHTTDKINKRIFFCRFFFYSVSCQFVCPYICAVAFDWWVCNMPAEMNKDTLWKIQSCGVSGLGFNWPYYLHWLHFENENRLHQSWQWCHHIKLNYERCSCCRCMHLKLRYNGFSTIDYYTNHHQIYDDSSPSVSPAHCSQICKTTLVSSHPTQT